VSVSVGGGVAVGGHADLLGGGGGHAPHPWGQTRPLGHGLGRAQGRRPGAPAGTLPAELAELDCKVIFDVVVVPIVFPHVDVASILVFLLPLFGGELLELVVLFQETQVDGLLLLLGVALVLTHLVVVGGN